MGRQLAARALQVKEDKPKLQKVIEERWPARLRRLRLPGLLRLLGRHRAGKDSAREVRAGRGDSKAMLETILVSLKTGCGAGAWPGEVSDGSAGEYRMAALGSIGWQRWGHHKNMCPPRH